MTIAQDPLATQPKQGGMSFSNIIFYQCHKQSHKQSHTRSNAKTYNFSNKPSQYSYKPKIQAHIAQDYQEGEENKDFSIDYDKEYDEEEEGIIISLTIGNNSV